MKFLAFAACLWVTAGGMARGDGPNAFPYSEFAKFTEKIPGQTIGGVVALPAYLKPVKAGEKLDPAKAHFRIQLADGTSVPLRCETLPLNPDEAANPVDKQKIRTGYTHKLWVPKDPVKYAGAVLLNDLPAGFLDVQFPLPPRDLPASEPGK